MYEALLDVIHFWTQLETRHMDSLKRLEVQRAKVQEAMRERDWDKLENEMTLYDQALMTFVTSVGSECAAVTGKFKGREV